MSVTSPLSWLTLAGCILFTGICVFWSFLGEIPTTVQGQGILITQGAVRDVASSANGRIEELRVRMNDTVRKGQVLARLSRPDLEVQINEATARLKELEIEQELVGASDWGANALKRKYLEEQRQALEKAAALGEERLKALSEKAGAETGPKRGGPDAIPDKNIGRPAVDGPGNRPVSERIEQYFRPGSRPGIQAGKKDLVFVQQRISRAEANLKALRKTLRASEEVL